MTVKVCFVALNAYPAIDPLVPGTFGGIETRSWTFASALAKNADFEVSFLVRHTKQLRKSQYDHVKLLSILDPYYDIRCSLLSRLKRSNRFPWIQLRQPRLLDAYYLPLLAVLKLFRKQKDPRTPEPRLDDLQADVLLIFGLQSHSASVIASAKALNVPSVLFLASDSDLNENYLPGNDFVSVYGDKADVCYWAIQNADKIFCQTEAQQHRLKNVFRRDSEIVRNPIDVETWDSTTEEPSDFTPLVPVERYALWVGRADPVHKRPQDLIEIAKLCPEIPFLVIMNKRDDILEAELKRAAPQNVTFVEHVPFRHMPVIYSKAFAFVNTSALEGFPNTFLQAAISNVPIISINVEQEFLLRANAGFFAQGSIEKAAEQLRSIWNETAPLCHGREYVIEHYDLKQQVEHLASTLKRVVTSA